MEFWGVEVKPGQSLKVQPELFKLIHISQASLGEFKEGKAPKNVSLKLKVNGKDFVIGCLSGEEKSQLMFDLVFEKEFELSHGWKNGSVYFLGYVADDQVSDGEDEFDDIPEDTSEDELVPIPENVPVKEEKPAPKKVAVPVKQEKPASEDEDDSDDSEDDEDSDESMGSSDEEDEEEVPTPQKVAQPAKKNAKRPAESPKDAAPAKKNKSEQKGSPFAGKNSGGKPQQGNSNKKPQGGNNKSPQGGNKSNGKQGGNKFSGGQKGKAGGSNRK